MKQLRNGAIFWINCELFEVYTYKLYLCIYQWLLGIMRYFLANFYWPQLSNQLWLSGWLNGKALTFHQKGSRLDSYLGQNKNWALVYGQTATLVGRMETPVIPASGKQPADQGWDKNYGIAKR